MTITRRFLNGDMRLPVTFWGLLAISYLMNIPLIPLVKLVADGNAAFIAGIYVWFAVMIVYEVFFIVSIWRCTAKYAGSKVWALSARFWMIMWEVGKLNLIKQVVFSGAG